MPLKQIFLTIALNFQNTQYDKTDLHPFIYRKFSKPIPQWFLAIEMAMLQLYSTVYENTPEK